MDGEPFSAIEVRRRILAILSGGTVRFSSHAKDEMRLDQHGAVLPTEVLAVLRGGVVEPGEFERGSWRYRVRTQWMFVAVAFDSDTALVVVTVYRVRR